jgi:hypothetical protein
MNICKTLIFLMMGCDLAYAQAKPPFALKKLSDFRSEKERCAYIVDLADAHFLDFAHDWGTVRPVFDLGLRGYPERDGDIIASLSDPLPVEKADKAGPMKAQARNGHWYVVINLVQGKILRFYLSNISKEDKKPVGR